jgi:hypothetical protein
MAAEMPHPPVASRRRQRVAAWIALTLALVYPLTVVFNAITILTWRMSTGGAFAPDSLVAGFMYLVGFAWYIEWPLPIVAVYLASLVLRDSRWRNRVAWSAMILGALSLLVMAGLITTYIISANSQ